MGGRAALPEALRQESHDMFADSIGRFFDREAGPVDVAAWREAGVVPRPVWKVAGAAGILGASVPLEYGGGGGDFGHEAILMREIGLRNLEAWSLTVHNGIVIPYLVNYGSAEQKKRWLPQLCSGDLICALAMTEPEAGSDVQAIRTTARRDDGDFIINGQKTFISNGQNADLILLAAKTDPDAGGRGISLIVVETENLEGFRRGRNLAKIGNDMSDTSELFFDNVRVPAANLIGSEPGHGFAQMMSQLPQERLAIALLCQGTIERALALTIDYVKERQAFGKRLLDFQNTQFVLADLKARGMASAAFVTQCCTLHLQGGITNELSAMVKLHVSELACRVVDECLQLFGGYGYMTEYPIAQMYKDVRVRRILGGSSEMMKLIIARTL